MYLQVHVLLLIISPTRCPIAYSLIDTCSGDIFSAEPSAPVACTFLLVQAYGD